VCCWRREVSQIFAGREGVDVEGARGDPAGSITPGPSNFKLSVSRPPTRVKVNTHSLAVLGSNTQDRDNDPERWISTPPTLTPWPPTLATGQSWLPVRIAGMRR
jgi:hypothetical protein